MKSSNPFGKVDKISSSHNWYRLLLLGLQVAGLLFLFFVDTFNTIGHVLIILRNIVGNAVGRIRAVRGAIRAIDGG